MVLSWQAVAGASSYVLQRRAVGEGAYAVANNVTVSDTTYTDKNFDPFTAYMYQVFAIVGGNPGLASTQVTAGPPPTGFSVAARTPKAALDALTGQWYGRLVSMTLDANGDPAIAFQDGSGVISGNLADTNINFVAWDRAKYQFKAPVVVDSVHGQTPTAPHITLAYDAGANRFGVLYVSNLDAVIRVAFSTDGGATWTPQNLIAPNGPAMDGGCCSFTMANGQAYVVYTIEPGGTVYATGSQTAAAMSWSRQSVPGMEKQAHTVYSVAVDSAGKPGVAYAYNDFAGRNDYVMFWRPGSTPVQVTTSNGFGNMIGNPDVRLAFAGTNPRIAMFFQRTTSSLTDLWVSTSSDGGATWGAPMEMPSDGNNAGQRALINFVIGPQGQAVLSASASGGTANGMKCGFPKLTRSTDLQTWTACGPGGTGLAPMIPNYYPSLAFASNAKLYLAFHVSSSQPADDLAFPGVWLWREAPTASGMNGPAINSGGIINNASHAAGKAVAPGSIAEIYGLNLGQLSSAGTMPLPGTLGPSGVLTTFAAVNGIAAPAFFVSNQQVNVQIPFEIPVGKDAGVTITVNDTISPGVNVRVNAYAPGIYAAVNAAGNLNTGRPGDYLTVYMTGLGAVTNAPANGAASPANPLANVTGTVTATIGGQNAPVSFSGLTPYTVGLYQVNLQIPSLAPGSYPLVISESGAGASAVASNSVTITVTQ